MKKFLIGSASTIAVLFVAIGFLLTMDFNRMNKGNVYVQIPSEEHVLVVEDKLSDGTVIPRYWYTLSAYNEEGEKVTVEFSAAKMLREGAYLMLYLKKGTNEVSSYDEVQEDELPEEVKANL